MTEINFAKIPNALRYRDQWILWKNAERDGKPTKVPVQVDGTPAKSNDAATWASFDTVCAAYRPEEFAGIGFVFSADDPLIGIDLDGCRDPESGRVTEWAREIILKFGSYAEVSPSGTGVKLFCIGESPFGSGRKIEVKDAERIGEKLPAIEVYDRGRYFAVTGLALRGQKEPSDSGDALTWLKGKYWPEEPARPVLDFRSNDAVVERARKYLAKMPVAVSGQGGHNTTFHTACVLVLGFELSEHDAVALMTEWNAGCQPPWSDREIVRKVREANKQTGQRGYLRDVAPANWGRIAVPTYTKPQSKRDVRVSTLADASQKYIDSVRSGVVNLVSTSIPDLDYALGGGVEFGELVIFGARPSHGKSAVALQCLHHWTSGEDGAPGAIVSEEMSALMLGKRTMQHFSTLPAEHWRTQADKLERELACYRENHADCFVLEGCGTADAAAEAIERHVENDGVRFAVIDYAQLLKSEGKSRYEQVTNTSIVFRQLASRTKVVLLVLCQLNRGVEQRGGAFLPVMSDLKDSGQLEQDADVVSLLCWPHRIDQKQPIDRFQFFIGKNRNRIVREFAVECQFIPERQMFRDAPPEELRELAHQWRSEIPE